jgi:alpha-tubulin suppressor-like RCC1 family protein
VTRSRIRFAVAVVASSAVAACFSRQDHGSPPPEASLPSDDGTAPGEAGPADATTLADRAALEAAPDGPPEAEAPEAEAGLPEAGVEDASEAAVDAPADVGADVGADAGADAGAEAGAEASADAAVDATADAAPDAAAPDASDAAVSCLIGSVGGHDIFGDHYLRTDGKLFYAPSGSHTLVTSATTGLALLGITEVVQQPDHACGLRNDGTVWCWALGSSGGNTNGDLGNGTLGGTNLGAGVATEVVTNAADAGAPAYLGTAVHLSMASDTAYTFPTCAILSNRTVWCWGFSTAQTNGPDGLFWGSTGSVASVPYAIPIAAAPADGGPPPTVVADQVSIGGRHACVLSGGQVSCWGADIAGNLGQGASSLGFQVYPVPVMTGYGLPATVDEIGCGYDFTCARAGGSVWCWGTSGWGMIGNPSVPPSICNSNYCQPVPTPVQQSSPDGGSTLVPDAGYDQSPLVGAASLRVGYQFACVLDTSGTVWCWGATNGGVSSVPMATPYTSTVAYSNVTELTLFGGDSNTGLRYLTASGLYVSGRQVITPYCL